MLVDVNVPSKVEDVAMSTILEVLSDGNPMPIRLQKGVYQIHHFSLNIALGWRQSSFEDQFPELNDTLSCYGVCDSVDQLLQLYRTFLENDPRRFVVSVTELLRENQPEVGGWRWHKWGPYIGTQKPQHEYLYDETHINRVFTFHFLVVPKGA